LQWLFSLCLAVFYVALRCRYIHSIGTLLALYLVSFNVVGMRT